MMAPDFYYRSNWLKINKLLAALGLVTVLPLKAGTMGDTLPAYPWFASIGTGYSWTNLPGIDNPDPAQWDYASQGYDAPIGNRGFYTFAIGKQVHNYVDVSLSYLAHENFNYQQFQSGTSSTPDFTGNQRTRYFTLNNRALLINGFLHPARSWAQFINFELMPYVGAGIGYANNKVDNFYTIGNTTVSGVAIGSTDSIGDPNSKNSFAWQGTIALSIRPQQSHFSLNTGYRYFDGGSFDGATSIYTNANGYVNADPWTGRVKANQVFVELQYTV